MAKVELKAPIVAAITEDVKDAKSLVLVDYRGLTVEQDTQLRAQNLQSWIPSWKARARSPFQMTMLPHRPASWLSSVRQLKLLN